MSAWTDNYCDLKHFIFYVIADFGTHRSYHFIREYLNYTKVSKGLMFLNICFTLGKGYNDCPLM